MVGDCEIVEEAILMVTGGSLASETGVPKMMNSVLEGLRARPLLLSQEISERHSSREVMLVAISTVGKERKSCVSSA